MANLGSRPPDPAKTGLLSWFRLPRKLKVTREGKYFIGITMGVGFAAVNTGNNLLYLLLGLLLSLIVVSSVMSELTLRDLSVTRRLPPRAQVGRPHLVEIEVQNSKGRVPSYAIEIEDLRAGQPADKRCFFLKISPGSGQVAAYRRTPGKRGADQHVGFRIATRFPFGFFEKSREVESPGELIIYPAVDPVRLPPATRGSHRGAEGQVPGGQGQDVVGVRPMREGDEVRDIYWKKSIHQMVVWERAREVHEEITLSVDNIPPEGADLAEWNATFERRIRDVASRAVAHLVRGDAVVVRAPTGPSSRADVAVGADPLLRFLALLQPASGNGPTPLPTTTSDAPTSEPALGVA